LPRSVLCPRSEFHHFPRIVLVSGFFLFRIFPFPVRNLPHPFLILRDYCPLSPRIATNLPRKSLLDVLFFQSSSPGLRHRFFFEGPQAVCSPHPRFTFSSNHLLDPPPWSFQVSLYGIWPPLFSVSLLASLAVSFLVCLNLSWAFFEVFFFLPSFSPRLLIFVLVLIHCDVLLGLPPLDFSVPAVLPRYHQVSRL